MNYCGRLHVIVGLLVLVSVSTKTLMETGYKINYINETEYNILKPSVSRLCYYFNLYCK
jgi:hypothetical protein